MNIEVRHACALYGKKSILEDVSFTLRSKEILCLLGPNGAGKSTLFKGMLAIEPFVRGQVLCDGNDMATWSRSRIARTIAYIPQSHTPTFQYTALDIVLMGRTSHIGRFATPSKKDVCVAEEALATVRLTHLKKTLYKEMSGGERQLVLIARALAQQPKFLFMDEPTNNLDFGNQVLVLHHIRELAQNGLGIMMASHYPDHAFLYASKVVLLKKGSVVGWGAPEETVTEESLQSLYGVRIHLADVGIKNGHHSVKVCVPAASDSCRSTLC